MKRFSLWLVLTVLAVFPATAAAIPVTIETEIAQFTLSDSMILVGETFSVTVSVAHNNSSDLLTSYGFDVDPGALLSNVLLTGYSIGAGYDDFGSGDYIAGFQGTDPSQWQAPGTTLLATLFFEAVGAGTDTLAISGVWDGFSSGLYYLTSDFRSLDMNIAGSTSITVYGGASAVPIPSPILLLGTGLVGIGLGRKRGRGFFYLF